MTIRTRLTLWYAGALAAALLLYAAGVYLFLEHRVMSQLDWQVHERYETAEHFLERAPSGTVRWHGDSSAKEEGRWLEVWSVTGQLLYRDGPAPLGFPASMPQQDYLGPESVALADGARARVLTGRHTIDGLAVLIRVAESEDRPRHELQEILLVLALGLPGAVALAGLGGTWLARRALRPIETMAERARKITAERLADRLPVENPGDELGRLSAAFNDTLARLEGSFEQLRRFTSDASHELRTPLTALRSVGEVGLRQPRDEASYREIIGSMLEETDRLARLVDSLLTLSRADAGQVQLNRSRIELDALARDVANLLSPLAEEKRQSISVEARAPVAALVDPLIFRQALVNLVENAIRHCPDETRIRVVVRDGPPTLEVIDNGPGIASEHHDKVFDRFYRVDPARSRESGGTGLGLSIARWAVAAHGGRIELESQVGRGSTFRIVLP